MENIVHIRPGRSHDVRVDEQRREGHLICLNAGSSSLKVKLFDLSHISRQQGLKAIVSGSVKLRSDHADVHLEHRDGKSHSVKKPWDAICSDEVLGYLLSTMEDLLVECHKLDIKTIMHRVVHGAHLAQCVSITRSDQHNLKTLEFLAGFAPLHNAVSVQLIRACLRSERLSDDCESVCCFDTAFHASLNDTQYRYMVDPNLAGTALPGGMELRKWGFHGLSYESILNTLAEVLNKDRASMNLIICHLGSGSSICGVVAGKSYDTSMGLTPLEGLPGASRSGSVDPALPLHLGDCIKDEEDGDQEPVGWVEIAEGIRVSRAELILNKQSGFKAVAGVSDFEQICRRRANFVVAGKNQVEGNAPGHNVDKAAALAFDIFIDRIVGFLGSYTMKMSNKGGVDAVVFSGGIGEESTDLHAELARQLDMSSLSPAQELCVDDKSQKVWQLQRDMLGLGATSRSINTGQCVPWYVCKTDEETEMARQFLAASST